MTPRDRSPDRLFLRDLQLELIDRSVEQQTLDQEAAASDADDEARRAIYLERLRALLPELRKIEGFPIGTDEDILALSDPPYYTACPNPFLGEFIAEHGTPYDEATDDYHREPFAADVSEGKNDPIYYAHTYHTKVPHKAIMRYILHYTTPGDIVFDGFCGTGMTGVAAQLCGSPDPVFRAQVEAEWTAAGHEPPDWGARYAILGDLSPAATFIAYNYNTPVDVEVFEREAKRILDGVEAELGWMYETTHTDGSKGRINYVVWSDVFLCPSCGGDVVWWDATVRELVLVPAACPSCGYNGAGLKGTRATETFLDPSDGSVRVRARQHPVLTEYFAPLDRPRRHRRRSRPDDVPSTVSFPANAPVDDIRDGPNARQPANSHGASRAYDFWTPRNLAVIAALWAAFRESRIPAQGMVLLTSFMVKTGSRLHNIGFKNGSLNLAGQVPNTLFIPSVSAERNLFIVAAGKLDDIRAMFRESGSRPASRITTHSADDLRTLRADSVDYIFTDPPFGGNINYSDVSSLWETWLRVLTSQGREAIVNGVQGKALVDYQRIMEACFREYWRVLKPGRWMTVEFHNSSNAVWNAIQEAIQRAGFVVADVRTLDKQQGTFKQMTTSGAVKQDLVISAYKPRAGFEQRFSLEAGTEQGAWAFVRQHLDQLPVFVERAGLVEVIAERQDYLLFDRMVAFHIQRGVTVPLSAAAFYGGLRQRFPERDRMFFTELQAADYDQRRLEARDVEQLSIFVVDEKSAIAWLRAELGREPQTFQDLQPKFLRELQQNRFEALPELRDILEQGFLEDPATHRWRVPDSGKQADLEALRLRALLAEFAEYRTSSGKLKRFRIEAVGAGFADLWAKREYRGIITLAGRLPDEVVQEDPALLMYYDNAVTRDSAG
jgi:DNA modification methylase/predicted RNA-binding Zn-ribbon protein involved in translation (DUF1610 family)